MSSLFDAAADITRPLGVKKPDPLTQYEYSDIGLGWCLHVGYSVDWDEGNADVWIHTLELNTGQRVIPLALNEIPADELRLIESLIADEEVSAAHDAALELYRNRNDDGDYSLDAQRDRLAALEPDESR